jgi:hypothetical protein
MKYFKILTFQVIGMISLLNLKQVWAFFTLKGKYSFFCERFQHNAQQLKYYQAKLYAWEKWREEIKKSFSRNLPLWFLHNKTLSSTMVFGGCNIDAHQEKKLAQIEKSLSNYNIKNMLKESILGFPCITNLKYLTSNNTIHQTYHLSSYAQFTGFDIMDSDKIIEWGGGYGCMARIIKNVNPSCTYIIIDLPELCILQYIYLTSLFGINEVFIIDGRSSIIDGKINIMQSNYLIHSKLKIKSMSFISNWAITESAKEYQDFVLLNNLFDAEKILISSAQDENNYILSNKEKLRLKMIEIDVINGNSVYLLK